MATTGNTGKQQQLKIAKLIEDLHSGNENKVSAALKALQSIGDVTILKPIAEILLNLDKKSATRSEYIEFLSSLKSSDAIEEVMEIVRDDKFASIRQEILGTIWNSPLDYSYFLPEFVEIAVDGNFMEALECLTIIENMEGPFEERHILESQLHLRDYIEDTDPKDPQKAQIMSEIALIIKDFDLGDDDGIDFFNA